MSLTLDLVHESTLVGAMDSFLKELVHVRPFVAKRYAAVLEEMAGRWLKERGVNQLGALDAQWLIAYISEAVDKEMTTRVLHEFYRWALHRNLLAENPFLLDLDVGA